MYLPSRLASPRWRGWWDRRPSWTPKKSQSTSEWPKCRKEEKFGSVRSCRVLPVANTLSNFKHHGNKEIIPPPANRLDEHGLEPTGDVLVLLLGLGVEDESVGAEELAEKDNVSKSDALSDDEGLLEEVGVEGGHGAVGVHLGLVVGA